MAEVCIQRKENSERHIETIIIDGNESGVKLDLKSKVSRRQSLAADDRLDESFKFGLCLCRLELEVSKHVNM
uniref:Uncharacterized protein n=1 Tax=Picea sitchensis TaxID=3332 RepID=A9NXL1_PICSI|nr:unknown [Picea sitchensis]